MLNTARNSDSSQTLEWGADQESPSTGLGKPKKLTVTFRDVAVAVDGIGEDYGSTFFNVVTSLIPSMKGNKSKRVSRLSSEPEE